MTLVAHPLPVAACLLPGGGLRHRRPWFVELDDRVASAACGVAVVRAPRAKRPTRWAPTSPAARAPAGLCTIEARSALGRPCGARWRRVSASGRSPAIPADAAEAIARAAPVRRAMIVAALPPARDAGIAPSRRRMSSLATAPPVDPRRHGQRDGRRSSGRRLRDQRDARRRSSACAGGPRVAEAAHLDVPADAIASLDAWWQNARHAPLALHGRRGHAGADRGAARDDARPRVARVAGGRRGLPRRRPGGGRRAGPRRRRHGGRRLGRHRPCLGRRAPRASPTRAPRRAPRGGGARPDDALRARPVGAGARRRAAGASRRLGSRGRRGARAARSRASEDSIVRRELVSRWMSAVGASAAASAQLPLRRAGDRARARDRRGRGGVPLGAVGDRAGAARRRGRAALRARRGRPGRSGRGEGRARAQRGETRRTMPRARWSPPSWPRCVPRGRPGGERRARRRRRSRLATDGDDAAQGAQHARQAAARVVVVGRGRRPLRRGRVGGVGGRAAHRGASRPAQPRHRAPVEGARRRGARHLRGRARRGRARRGRARLRLRARQPLGRRDAPPRLRRGPRARRAHAEAPPAHRRPRRASRCVLGNLAELRRRLGLIDHAEHASPSAAAAGPGHAAGALGAVLAARGAQRADARQHRGGAARSDAGAGGERGGGPEATRCCEAYCVATRVALEDGDLARAGELLERARAAGHDRRAPRRGGNRRGPSRARATATTARRQALEALAAARASGKEELVIEAHTLLAEIHRAAGRPGLGARARGAARSRFATRLPRRCPSDVRAAFLARPDRSPSRKLQRARSSEAASQDDRRPSSQSPVRSSVRAAPRPRRARWSATIPRSAGSWRPSRRSRARTAPCSFAARAAPARSSSPRRIHRASDRADGPARHGQLRGPRRDAAAERALRPREGRLHRRHRATPRPLRAGRGRHALPRRDRRHLAADAGRAAARPAGAHLRARRRHDAHPRRTSASSARPTATSRRWSSAASSARTSTTACAASRSRCPPLRARMGDLPAHRRPPPRAHRRRARRAEEDALASDALELLGRHRWPGNVRELENALRAASLFADGDDHHRRRPWPRTSTTCARAGAAPGSRRGRDRLRRAVAGARRRRGARARRAATLDEAEPTRRRSPAGEANATAVAYAQVRAGGTSLSDMKRQIERDCIARALAETQGEYHAGRRAPRHEAPAPVAAREAVRACGSIVGGL